jgi:predicted phosphodiesterase
MKKYYLLLILTSFIYANAEDSFKFIVVGDRTGGHVKGIFEEVINEVKLLKPDFTMCVGDLIEGYTEDTMTIHAQWDTVINIVKELPCKFYYVVGNHDINNENDRKIYERRTGFNRYYSFDYKNSHFIVLDNSMVYPDPSSQEMSEEQMKWLKDDLEKYRNMENIFVFYHVPTYLYSLKKNTQDTLMGILEQYKVDIVFTGHHHEYSYLGRNGVEYINVGSSGGGMGTNDFARGHFYHYLMVSVKGKENEIAVIRKGNVFPRNVITQDDISIIERADSEVVQIDTCIIKDTPKKSIERVSVRISNLGADSLIQTIKWEYDSTRYSIIPEKLTLAIDAGEKKEYRIQFTINSGSDIFPIPEYSLAYPLDFEYGKVCTLKNYIPVKRLKEVKKCKKEPVLDGKLNDVAWKNIEPITGLGTYDGQPDPPVEKTKVYFCNDKENLYMAARCFESDFSELKAEETKPDSKSPFDDNLWLFFDSNLDKKTYYQAIINSNGAVFDRKCSLIDGESKKDIEWNGPWEVATGREKNAWLLEIKIPKEGLEPYSDKQWGFNFRRFQPRKGMGDAGYWSIPFVHDPKHFGILQLE